MNRDYFIKENIRWLLLILIGLVLIMSIINYHEQNYSPSLTLYNDENCSECWWKLSTGRFEKYKLLCEGVECAKLKKMKIAPHTLCMIFIKENSRCNNGKCPSSYMIVNGSDTSMIEDIEEFIGTNPNNILSIKVMPCK
jgi:hypothetical protein